MCPAPEVSIPNEDLHWPISSLTEVPSGVSGPLDHSLPGLSTAAPREVSPGLLEGQHWEMFGGPGPKMTGIKVVVLSASHTTS